MKWAHRSAAFMPLHLAIVAARPSTKRTHQPLNSVKRHKGHAHALTLALAGFAVVVFSGCLPRPSTVSTRNFVLAPVLTNEAPSPAKEQLSVGIGYVKIPSYLLRDSMAVRNSATEIAYLDDARWGERLDQSFRRVVAADLSVLLPSDSIYLTDWAGEHVAMTVSITVEQFDVDMRGRATLRAQWRITPSASGQPSRDGNARLVRNGAPPHGNPEVIASRLSELTAEFSRELAGAIQETANGKAQGK